MFENWAGLFAIVERAIANGRFNRANHRKAKMNKILQEKFNRILWINILNLFN